MLHIFLVLYYKKGQQTPLILLWLDFSSVFCCQLPTPKCIFFYWPGTTIFCTENNISILIQGEFKWTLSKHDSWNILNTHKNDVWVIFKMLRFQVSLILPQGQAMRSSLWQPACQASLMSQIFINSALAKHTKNPNSVKFLVEWSGY